MAGRATAVHQTADAGEPTVVFIDALGVVSVPYTDFNVTRDILYYYVLTVTTSDGESGPSDEVSATRAGSFVVSKALSTRLRNDFTGWAGMAIQVGANALTISALGRIFAPGNSRTHEIKIVDAAAGADLLGGSVAVDMAGGTDGNFLYASLESSVTLEPNAIYYVLSKETIGLDQFYANDTTVQTTNAASVTSAVYGDGISPYITIAAAGHTYGPVDFLY